MKIRPILIYKVDETHSVNHDVDDYYSNRVYLLEHIGFPYDYYKVVEEFVFDDNS